MNFPTHACTLLTQISLQDPFRHINLATNADMVMAYKRGGDYFPVDEEYHLKRVVVRRLYVTLTRTRNLDPNIKASLSAEV